MSEVLFVVYRQDPDGMSVYAVCSSQEAAVMAIGFMVKRKFFKPDAIRHPWTHMKKVRVNRVYPFSIAQELEGEIIS